MIIFSFTVVLTPGEEERAARFKLTLPDHVHFSGTVSESPRLTRLPFTIDLDFHAHQNSRCESVHAMDL